MSSCTMKANMEHDARTSSQLTVHRHCMHKLVKKMDNSRTIISAPWPICCTPLLYGSCSPLVISFSLGSYTSVTE